MTFIDTWLFWLLSMTQPNAVHTQQVERPTVTVEYSAPKARGAQRAAPVLFSSSVGTHGPHEICDSELRETTARISNGY